MSSRARIPAALPGLVAPFDPRLGSNTSTIAINQINACRVVVPKSGTLHDLAVYIGTSSGNLQLGVYDTNDASAGNRSLLYGTGSVASPGTGWRIIGDPAIAVYAGQQLDFAAIVDNTTIALVRYSGFIAAQNTLPTSFAPAPGGASPKLAWTNSPGSFTLPTIAEANCATALINFLIIARVT